MYCANTGIKIGAVEDKVLVRVKGGGGDSSVDDDGDDNDDGDGYIKTLSISVLCRTKSWVPLNY